ncbi:MAG: FecR domain-containing protein [Pseudomonadales bacterium]|nr:FecR domain-containing protein [Pseudomonadales bacterium]
MSASHTSPPTEGVSTHQEFEQLEQAAHWFAVMQSGNASAHEQQQWQRWLAENDQHQQAWQQVEGICQQFNQLPAKPSRAALDAASNSVINPVINRRQAVKGLAAAAIALPIWQLSRQRQWPEQLLASHLTSVGEIRQFTLDDGSQIWLNSATSADVIYNVGLRRIVLYSGEIYIETTKDTLQASRPLVVDTRHGRLRALGTRFSVRHHHENTHLAVMESAVEISLKNSPNTQKHRINAGQQVSFNDEFIQPATTLPAMAESWTQGMIIADNMRLDDFIEQLNRYYRGHLSVDPSATDLRLVGAYPVTDIDRILAALEQSHPISISHTLPWWKTIRAR